MHPDYVHVISIVALVAVFTIATVWRVHMGALAFGVAFVIGTTVVGESTKQILRGVPDPESASAILPGFPGDLFLTLVGLTLLFAIAKENRTIDWLVHRSVHAVGGRIAAIPWVMFAVTALLTSFGAVGPAAVAIIAPIAMGLAARYGIKPVLMGLMVANGASAGGFSPLGVFGSIVDGILENKNLPASPLMLFLSSMLFNIALCVVVFFLFGGRAFLGKRGSGRTGEQERAGGGVYPAAKSSAGARAATVAEENEEAPLSLNRNRAFTLAGIGALAVGALADGLSKALDNVDDLDFDIGFLAISVAVLLSLAAPNQTRKAVDKVAWSTVLLICGIVTYVNLLDRNQTLAFLGDRAAGIEPHLLAAMLICYIGAVVSAFASTTGILGALIPLAAGFLLKSDIGPVGLIIALAISSSVVDASPFSTSGALVVENSGPESETVFRQLRIWGFSMVAIAPVVTWLIFILPAWL